jgi:hypothetical protein
MAVRCGPLQAIPEWENREHLFPYWNNPHNCMKVLTLTRNSPPNRVPFWDFAQCGHVEAGGRK